MYTGSPLLEGVAWDNSAVSQQLQKKVLHALNHTPKTNKPTHKCTNKHRHFASGFFFCFFWNHSTILVIFISAYLGSSIVYSLPCLEYFQIGYNYFKTNGAIRLKINPTLHYPNIYSSVNNHSACQENCCFLCGFHWLTKMAIHIQPMVSIGYVNTTSVIMSSSMSLLFFYPLENWSNWRTARLVRGTMRGSIKEVTRWSPLCFSD